jgi:hypothetical protein
MVNILVRKLDGTRPLGRPRHIDGYIKIDLKEIACEYVDWSCVIAPTSVMLCHWFGEASSLTRHLTSLEVVYFLFSCPTLLSVWNVACKLTWNPCDNEAANNGSPMDMNFHDWTRFVNLQRIVTRVCKLQCNVALYVDYLWTRIL